MEMAMRGWEFGSVASANPEFSSQLWEIKKKTEKKERKKTIDI